MCNIKQMWIMCNVLGKTKYQCHKGKEPLAIVPKTATISTVARLK